VPPGSRGTTASEISVPDVPPWEVRVVSQVPYVSRSPTPPATDPGTSEYQTTRTLRSHSDSHNESRLAATNDTDRRSEYNSSLPRNTRGVHWTKRRHTSAFPPPQTVLAPYETPLDLPAGLGNVRPRSFMGAANPPPSPPDSPSSCNRSDTSTSRDVRPKALPGTMSSQASTARDSSRTRSAKTNDPASTARSQSEQRPIGKRLSSAFRDMFKKEPLNESGLERISDRHWSEES